MFSTGDVIIVDESFTQNESFAPKISRCVKISVYHCDRTTFLPIFITECGVNDDGLFHWWKNCARFRDVEITVTACTCVTRAASVFIVHARTDDAW